MYRKRKRRKATTAAEQHAFGGPKPAAEKIGEVDVLPDSGVSAMTHSCLVGLTVLLGSSVALASARPREQRPPFHVKKGATIELAAESNGSCVVVHPDRRQTRLAPGADGVFRLKGHACGLYCLTHQADRGQAELPIRSTTKCFVMVGDRGTVAHQELHQPIGTGLEWLPGNSPAGWSCPTNEVSVRLVYAGEPIVGASAILEQGSERTKLRTDHEGCVSFVPGRSGSFTLSAMCPTPELGERANCSYEARLLLTVPKRCPFCEKNRAGRENPVSPVSPVLFP